MIFKVEVLVNVDTITLDQVCSLVELGVDVKKDLRPVWNQLHNLNALVRSKAESQVADSDDF